MSLATGISPRELLALGDEDVELYIALEEESARRWSPELEALWTNAQIAHAHLLTFVRANAGKKKPRLPPLLEIPRPEEDTEEKEPRRPAPTSIASFASQFGGSGELVGVSRGR